jgi:xanthine/uracil/vitamin C permease (AzgA family)
MSAINPEYFKNKKTYPYVFVTIAMILFDYSITEGIRRCFISYVVIFLISYFVELIDYFLHNDEENRLEWQTGFIAEIISILFLIYFFVPKNRN